MAFAVQPLFRDAAQHWRFAISLVEQGGIQQLISGFKTGLSPDPTGDGNGLTEQETRHALTGMGYAPQDIDAAVASAVQQGKDAERLARDDDRRPIDDTKAT